MSTKAAKVSIETLTYKAEAELRIRTDVEAVNLDKTMPKFKKDVEALAVDYGFEFIKGENW